MRLDEVFDDRQTEARAPLLPGSARIDTVEPLENAPQVVGRDPRTGIGYPDHGTRAGAVGTDANPASRRGVSQSVVEQVREDLTQRFGVSFNGRGVGRRLELNSLLGGPVGEGTPGIACRRVDAERLRFGGPASRLDA